MIQFLLLLAFTTLSIASPLSIQPIEKQVRESDGVFQGHYLKTKKATLENGLPVVQMFFKITQELGLGSDLYGMDEVIVHYPANSSDLPEFVTGEKAVLFIQSLDNRYWGMNLKVGTFKVINYGNEIMLVNSAEPQHPVSGQLSFERFEKVVKDIKGARLKNVYRAELIVPESNTSMRAPASVEEETTRAVASQANSKEEEQPEISILWLILALGITGGIFRMNSARVRK